jgi:hypothetical protein
LRLARREPAQRRRGGRVFARASFEADQRLGELAGCRWFLNWFDETPRAEMRRLLLAEVNRALAQRLSPQTSNGRPESGDTAAA